MKLSQIAFNSFILVSLAAIAGGCESQQRSPASGIRTVGYAAPSNGYGLMGGNFTQNIHHVVRIEKEHAVRAIELHQFGESGHSHAQRTDSS